MHSRHWALLGCCLAYTCLGFAECEFEGEGHKHVPTEPKSERTNGIPNGALFHATDHYLEGYIQALVDMHYYEYQVIVVVQEGNVYLSNLPNNSLISNSIISFVQDLPDVESLVVEDDLSVEQQTARAKYAETTQVCGIWFPQSTVLFLPIIADPREPVNSVNYRWGDKVIGKQVAAVSVGDDFPVFRWIDILPWHGDMQIGIQAGIWSVFNFKNIPRRKSHEVSELINTDYFVGIPLSYAFDKWSFRLRPYHISTHLGDEFLVNHPHFLKKRKNPSFEAIDFFTAYQFTSGIRGYLGLGWIVHSDPTFKMKNFYVEYGMELRMFGTKCNYHKLYATPFLAINFENWQVHNWDFDTTAKLGYEWSKLQGVGRKMRVYVGGHSGFSYEGQFFKKRVNFGEIGLSWGF